ncbi:hypothetical protein B0H14DRAFT_3461563 [Mycena olivaceomarginata]|nr:hypothetical protein B0H14DRAFT_3461563 [Mycena olivaceomarginata]
MASVIWVDSDGDDDLCEFVEPPTPRKPTPGPLAGPSTIEILETPNAKRHKATIDSSDSEDRVSNEEDHAVALALQAKWDEEDALAQRRAAKTEEKSLRLIARLQKMAEKTATARTAQGLTWFVNAKLEARFEAAKEVLNSLGIDTTEKNLFHGTKESNIEAIIKNGFLIPGVSPGAAMAHGSTCGVGIYLATISLNVVWVYVRRVEDVHVPSDNRAKHRPR